MKINGIIMVSLFFAMTVTHGAASNFKHITIDGSFDDWAGVTPAYIDPAFADDPTFPDDPSKFAGVTDLKAVYVANDDQYLYVRFTLYAPGDPFTAQNNVFIDADNDSTTGYHAVGGLIASELFIQNGTGYQEKNGGFNEGTVNGLGWLAAPSGAATDFEFRISRAAQYDSDGTSIFTGDTIAFLLEAENAQFHTVDVAPDTEGLPYTFTAAPPAATASSALITLTGTTWQVNTSGTDLGTAWREITYDDSSGAGWTNGLGLFGFTPAPSIYPAPIQTTLAPGPTTTYYFRTHFQWTNDPASVILVASNYLSDGALFYLNGSLVKSVRLPTGTNAFDTPATGGPATKGQVELAGFSTGPLVIGDNVLAVEVHQSAGDSTDLVFGNSLTAATQFPVTIANPSEPADRSVTAGNSTTFTAEFLGTGPLFFQWFKDSNSITNATNATLTINPVLQADAGSYTLKVSNPLATNVATRAAVLSVTGSPVIITDATQPADQAVTEGLPVSFSVVATGSAPLSYQWFKGSTAIDGETNATFTIPDVQKTDADDYHAVVSNPVPSSATSRTAHLTVNSDTTAPTISSAVATPNQITITFSEAVTEASVTNLSHYSSTGGLNILSAAQDTNDAAAVVLTTSAQTVGTSYTLTIKEIVDRFNNVASNSVVALKSSIIIDGSFDDWASVPLALTDPEDSTESTDYKDVYVTSDDDFIYMRVTLYSPSDFTIFYNNIFIDGDNDPTTGYLFRGGSEMVIQSGAGYQEKNGEFNEGTVDGLDWAIAPAGVGTDFEFRISRHASYTSDGQPVFTADTFNFLLESEDTSFNAKDTAPDLGGLAYTFSPASQGPRLTIAFDQGKVTISWPGAGKLQSRQSLGAGTWQDVTGAESGYSVPATEPETYYRVAQ